MIIISTNVTIFVDSKTSVNDQIKRVIDRHISFVDEIVKDHIDNPIINGSNERLREDMSSIAKALFSEDILKFYKNCYISSEFNEYKTAVIHHLIPFDRAKEITFTESFEGELWKNLSKHCLSFHSQ